MEPQERETLWRTRLNPQDLTPQEFEHLRQRYAELLLFRKRLTRAGKERVDIMSYKTENTHPEEYLIAFEEGVEFCKNFLSQCIREFASACQNYEHNHPE